MSLQERLDAALAGPNKVPFTPQTVSIVADIVQRWMEETGEEGPVPIFELWELREIWIGAMDAEKFESLTGRPPMIGELQILNERGVSIDRSIRCNVILERGPKWLPLPTKDQPWPRSRT